MITINQFLNNPNIIHDMTMIERRDLADRLERSRTFNTIYGYSARARLLNDIRKPNLKLIINDSWPSLKLNS